MEFLNAVNHEGITVLMITHDMHLMLEYTPRAIVLNDGEVVKAAEASTILTQPKVIEVANLKETSLYRLAQQVGVADETDFVQCFIDYERRQRQ